MNAETGQRGYALTKDPKFDEPYKAALISLPAPWTIPVFTENPIRATGHCLWANHGMIRSGAGDRPSRFGVAGGATEVAPAVGT